MNLFENQRVDYRYRNNEVLVGKAVFPNGEKHDWTTINFQNSVAVLPITESGKFLLLKQWRPAIKKWCVELVAGGIEKELSVFENVHKEVLEELGYKLHDDDIFHLNSFYVTPGLMNFKTYMYVALVKEENYVGQQLENTELISVFEATKADIYDMIRDKRIIDPELFIPIFLLDVFNIPFLKDMQIQ